LGASKYLDFFDAHVPSVITTAKASLSVVGDVDRVEADPSGTDAADDPRLPHTLLDRVDVSVEGRIAGVLTGDGVEVVERAIGGQLGVTTDLDVARGVVGIDDEQADLRVRDQVAPLLPLECGVDDRG
jgi:hypothetical protein